MPITPRTAHVLPDHRLTDARRFADLPEAHPKRVPEPQHVTHFAHRQSLRWHREPRSVAGSLITRFDRRRERRSARFHRLSAIIGTLSGLRRNPVRNASDSALKDLLKKKQSGERIEAPRERAPAKVINLMDALRRSVEAERGTGERRKPERSVSDRRAPKKAGRSNARAKKAG
jgi:hypothetical protein